MKERLFGQFREDAIWWGRKWKKIMKLWHQLVTCRKKGNWKHWNMSHFLLPRRPLPPHPYCPIRNPKIVCLRSWWWPIRGYEITLSVNTVMADPIEVNVRRYWWVKVLKTCRLGFLPPPPPPPSNAIQEFLLLYHLSLNTTQIRWAHLYGPRTSPTLTSASYNCFEASSGGHHRLKFGTHITI